MAVRILVPLVTRTEVLDFVLQTLVRARDDLTISGMPFNHHVPIGAMIEVAAAVPMVGMWAEQMDFFALGTNDLAASALGMDRDDPVTAGQIDPLHPGMLHLIHNVVTAAHKASRPVSVCGEMAADPLGAAALAALEVDSLSVPVNQYVATRRALAGMRGSELIGRQGELLRQRSARGVRNCLEEMIRRGS